MAKKAALPSGSQGVTSDTPLPVRTLAGGDQKLNPDIGGGLTGLGLNDSTGSSGATRVGGGIAAGTAARIRSGIGGALGVGGFGFPFGPVATAPVLKQKIKGV